MITDFSQITKLNIINSKSLIFNVLYNHYG
jgi:hypothetical protein